MRLLRKSALVAAISWIVTAGGAVVLAYTQHDPFHFDGHDDDN